MKVRSLPSQPTAAIVLAAGQGTRFRSDLAKVLHPVAGRTMLRWVLEALRPLGYERVIVVVGHQAAAVTAEAEAAELPGLVIVEQAEQRGTGHAVRVVVEAGALDGIDTAVVLPGDVPLLEAAALEAVHEGESAAATILATVLPEPAGYGRVLRDDRGDVRGIVEERDATPAEQAIGEVNSGIYAFAVAPLTAQLGRLSTDNAQGEEYLTDVIAHLVAAGERVQAVAGPPGIVAGVNDREQLAAAGGVLRARILSRLMRAGVTVVDPATTYVEADVEVAADAVLLPGTFLEGTTSVATGARIGPSSRLVDTRIDEGATVQFSVLVQAEVGPEATVGPYAYLRPGARLGPRAKAGTFVEIKQSVVGEGSKVPHLSYVGDATIGKEANIGAGTVTVNYDGQDKHPTVIGDGAFIGSDTMLVAPVVIGDGAYTGAGSVITKDVPDGALAVERTEQRIIPGYTDRKKKREQGPDSV